ncbi:MAG TPA: HIT domain-containing protein [Geminicoccaceae bacterium]
MTFASAPGIRALINLKPILPGHSLIVPDRHVARLLDLADLEVASLAAFARNVSALLVNVFNAAGMDWTLQDGPEAGQTVMHLHLHLIPRLAGDLPNPGDWYPALRQAQAGGSDVRPALSAAECRTIVARLRAAAADPEKLQQP